MFELPGVRWCNIAAGFTIKEGELHTMSKYPSSLYEFKPGTRKILAVGDLHGDINSLGRIITFWRKEPDTSLLFLGDYADRGGQGVAVIEALDELSGEAGVILLKGNHESYPPSGAVPWGPFDLKAEVEAKRKNWNEYYHARLGPFLEKLYTAAVLPGRLLFVHGGISTAISGIDSLRHPSPAVENDIIWSDPAKIPGQAPNRRGSGVEFGEDVTHLVLQRLGLDTIIRSHQPQLAKPGPSYCHHGMVITISSTGAYGSDYRPHILEITVNKLNAVNGDAVQLVYRVIYLDEQPAPSGTKTGL